MTKEYIDIPDLALMLREWYPDLDNRCFPAMGDDITKDNMPSLPFAVVIPMATNVEKWPTRGSSRTELSDDFQIEFWLEPERIKKENQTETPFWSFYDYRTIFILPLLTNIQKLSTHYGIRFEFRGAEVATTDAAIIVALRFRQHYNLCLDEAPETLNRGFIIKSTICPA